MTAETVEEADARLREWEEGADPTKLSARVIAALSATEWRRTEQIVRRVYGLGDGPIYRDREWFSRIGRVRHVLKRLPGVERQGRYEWKGADDATWGAEVSMERTSGPLKYDSEWLADLPDYHPLVDMYWSVAQIEIQEGRWAWHAWWGFPS